MLANIIIFGVLCLTSIVIFVESSKIPPLRADIDLPIELDEISGIEKTNERYRLPRSIIPKHYDFEIRPILDEGFGTRFTAPGHIKMLVDCVQNTNIVTFNAFTLNVTFVNITRLEDSTAMLLARHYQNDAFQTYNVELGGSQMFLSGKQYEIYVGFVAPIPSNRTDGLYLSSYLDSNQEKRYLAVTDFEADDCRRMTPVFDEPDLKATWNVSIIRKKTYKSLANARLLRTEEIPGTTDWEMDVYEKVGPLPSYLVALAVSDFESTDASPEFWNARPVKIWGPPPLIAAGGGLYAADLSAKILEHFETLLRTNSSLLKMDKISVPDYNSGAMENWGLNTYRESRLMFLPGVSSIDDQVRMTNTISHEIAHQFFGNLVTMKWWTDLHLNEGFATYFAAHGVAEVHPEHIPMETLIPNTIQLAMQADVLPTSHPLSNDAVESEAEIASMFSTITYHKGGSLLRMMDAFLTRETFIKGLEEYLKQFQFSNTVQNDLFAVLTTQAELDGSSLPTDVSVERIMTSWTKQTGFPVIRATRKVAENKVEFKQERYFPTGPSDSDETKWYIPITYNFKGDALSVSTKFWLDDQTESHEADADFDDDTKYVLVNPSVIGFYRVLYDDPNFQLLTQQLATDHISIDTLSRSALIDDAMNLGFADYTDIKFALDLTKYLNVERQLVPWVTFFTNMAMPYRMIARAGAYFDFRTYILGLIKEPLAAIKFEQQAGDTPGGQILLRTKLVEWACNLADSDCVTFAQEQFKTWMLDPTNNKIDPDLRSTIYCANVANGGDEIWEFILEQYKIAHVNSPSKYLPDVARISMIRALGCAKQSYRLAQLLDLALDYKSFLLPEHRLVALQAVAGNSVGVHLTFNFIRNNFETLIRRHGVAIFSNTVSTLSNYLNTNSDLFDLTTFVTTNSEALKDVKTSIDTSLANIEKNIKWVTSSKYNDFKSWLTSLTK